MKDMTTKTVCNVCGKDIGIRWFELRNIHKEMDYGMKSDERKYDLCSKACLRKLIDNDIKEFTKKEMIYDDPAFHDD